MTRQTATESLDEGVDDEVAAGVGDWAAVGAALATYELALRDRDSTARNLGRTTTALENIRSMHHSVPDGRRLICGHCAIQWPCEHASILADVQDLL